MRNWINLIETPEVRQDIAHVTLFSGRRLPPETIAWLSENYPVTEPLTLYRGFTIERDDMGGIANIASLDAICQKWLGSPSHDIIPGASLIYKTNRDTSWSHDPEIGRNFLTPRGSCYGKVMMRATIPASKIIVDLTKLPLGYQGVYPQQKEVIVRGGKFPVKIVWSSFREWNDHAMPGYNWGTIQDHYSESGPVS